MTGSWKRKERDTQREHRHSDSQKDGSKEGNRERVQEEQDIGKGKVGVEGERRLELK